MPHKSIIESLIKDHNLSKSEIARAIHVEPKSINNWVSNSISPRQDSVNALSALLSQYQQQTHTDNSNMAYREGINLALKELRETFHRRTKFSSRNDVLEEVCKLLFFQVTSLKKEQKNLCDLTFEPKKGIAVKLLKKCVDLNEKYMPAVLFNELNREDFYLKIKDVEDDLVYEALVAISFINWADYKTILSLDLFNEVFGKFLADSFSQEKQLGQYLTPIEMVQFMVKTAIDSLSTKEFEILTSPEKCKEFGYILDASCGVGSFLIEIVKQLSGTVKKNHGKEGYYTWISNISKHVVFGIDKSERMIKLAIANLALAGIESPNIHSLNSLSKSQNSDVLKEQLEGNVGLILTNPPFGAEYKDHDLQDYKIANEWSGKVQSKIDSEVLFVERYIDWLKEGGQCVTVVPDSILFNKSIYQELRSSIKEHIYVNSVVSFPSKTFAVAGTSAKTSVFHFVKGNKHTRKTFFAVCEDLGFDISTQSTHKVRVQSGKNELPLILNSFNTLGGFRNSGWKEFSTDSHRWDAIYHSLLSDDVIDRISSPKEDDVSLIDVAEVINERVNPTKNVGSFKYIEISDINSQTSTVQSKEVECAKAPSRARKVIRKGDVLVSTVRPEQRKVGVVDAALDNSICTTGLAVIRPKEINSLVLAELLKSDLVFEQLMRNNVGISYPSVDESVFKTLLLPIKKEKVNQADILANEILEAQNLINTKRELLSSLMLNS